MVPHALKKGTKIRVRVRSLFGCYVFLVKNVMKESGQLNDQQVRLR
jgi:hypothetical protein